MHRTELNQFLFLIVYFRWMTSRICYQTHIISVSDFDLKFCCLLRVRFSHIFFLLLGKSTLPMGFHQPSTISKSVVSCVFVEIYRTRFLCQQQPTSSDIVQFQYTSIYWMNNIFSNNKKKNVCACTDAWLRIAVWMFFLSYFSPAILHINESNEAGLYVCGMSKRLMLCRCAAIDCRCGTCMQMISIQYSKVWINKQILNINLNKLSLLLCFLYLLPHHVVLVRHAAHIQTPIPQRVCVRAMFTQRCTEIFFHFIFIHASANIWRSVAIAVSSYLFFIFSIDSNLELNVTIDSDTQYFQLRNPKQFSEEMSSLKTLLICIF